ncbi:MAG: DUF5118 domain-containing protein, partial [Winogradskyella sp.]
MNKVYISVCLLFVCLQMQAQILSKKDLKSYEGYFDFYYEESTDKIYLQVKNLNEDFLYVNALASGVGSNDI